MWECRSEEMRGSGCCCDGGINKYDNDNLNLLLKGSRFQVVRNRIGKEMLLGRFG